MDWGLVSPTGQEHKLRRSMMFVGREDCEVIINSKTVDKQHSVLNYDPFDDVYTVKDLGSVNGTFVNETRIPDHTYITLLRGDTVRFGYDVTTYRFDQLQGQSPTQPVASPSEAGRRRNVFEIDIDKYFNQYKKPAALGSNRESSTSYYKPDGDYISRNYLKLSDRDNTSTMSNQQLSGNHYGAASSKWDQSPYSDAYNRPSTSNQSHVDSEVLRRSQSDTFTNQGSRKSGDTPAANFRSARSTDDMDRPDSLNLPKSEKDIPVTFYHKRAERTQSAEEEEKLDRSGELTVKSKGNKHTSFTIEFKEEGDTSPTKRSIHHQLSEHVPQQVKKKIVENGKLVEDLKSERLTKKADDPEEEPSRKEPPAQLPSKRQQDSLAYPSKSKLAGKTEASQLANGGKPVESGAREPRNEPPGRRQSDSDSEELVNRMFGGGASQTPSKPAGSKSKGPAPSPKPSASSAPIGRVNAGKPGGKKPLEPGRLEQQPKDGGGDGKEQDNLSESGTYTIDEEDADEEEARKRIDRVFGIDDEAPDSKLPEKVKRSREGSLAESAASRQSQRSAALSDSMQQSKGMGHRSQVGSSRGSGLASDSSQKSSKSSKSSSQKSVVKIDKSNRRSEQKRVEPEKKEVSTEGVKPGDAQWVSEWASRQAARLSQEGSLPTTSREQEEVRRPPIGRSPVNLATSNSAGRKTPKGKRILPATPAESRGASAGGESSRSVVSDVLSSGSRGRTPDTGRKPPKKLAGEWDARSLDTDILLQDTQTVMAALESRVRVQGSGAAGHQGSPASSLDSDRDTASSTVSGSEVNRVRGQEPGAKPSTVWTRLSQPNRHKMAAAPPATGGARHSRRSSGASDSLGELGQPGRSSPDPVSLTSSGRRSRTSPVPAIQPRQTRATSLRKSFNVGGRESPTESSLSESSSKVRTSTARRSEVSRSKGAANSARSGVSLGEEIVRRSRSHAATAKSSRARSSSADRLPRTETATSLDRVKGQRPGPEVKRSQSFKKRSEGSGNVWRRYENAAATSDAESDLRPSGRRSEVSSSVGSSEGSLPTSDLELDPSPGRGRGHADEIARMSSDMARDLEQLTRGTRVFDTSGIKKEDTVLDDIFSEETIPTGRSDATSATLDSDISKTSSSILVDRKLGERLASSPNLALKKDLSSKKEAFDSLVLSSIYHLSVKLRKNANSISSKVKYLYKTDEDLNGGQSSSASRDAPLLKTANKEIAGILLNLRKIEKQLEDIDKTIDPHRNIQGVSQMSGEREERKEYIREMQWKHRELSGRRNSWQGGSLDSYDSPSPSDDGQFD